MNTYKGLPLYRAEIIDIDEGILDISLVENPATKQDFVLFQEQERVEFSVLDESKHIISGVVMSADTPIYRRSPRLGEFYILFSKELIQKMVEKMSREGRFNLVTLNHEDELVEGVTLIELFLKDSEKGINPSYLQDVPEGSLIASYKVENPTIWNQIKSGEFKGFSLSGFFSMMPDKKEDELDAILDLLDQVEAKYFRK